jgi:hypothetical protein
MCETWSQHTWRNAFSLSLKFGVTDSDVDDLPLVWHDARVDLNPDGARIRYTKEPTLLAKSPHEQSTSLHHCGTVDGSWAWQSIGSEPWLQGKGSYRVSFIQPGTEDGVALSSNYLWSPLNNRIQWWWHRGGEIWGLRRVSFDLKCGIPPLTKDG